MSNAFKRSTNAFKRSTNAFKRSTNAFKRSKNAFYILQKSFLGKELSHSNHSGCNSYAGSHHNVSVNSFHNQ